MDRSVALGGLYARLPGCGRGPAASGGAVEWATLPVALVEPVDAVVIFQQMGFALKELKMMAIEGMLQPETQDLSPFDDLCLGKLLIGCH